MARQSIRHSFDTTTAYVIKKNTVVAWSIEVLQGEASIQMHPSDTPYIVGQGYIENNWDSRTSHYTPYYNAEDIIITPTPTTTQSKIRIKTLS